MIILSTRLLEACYVDAQDGGVSQTVYVPPVYTGCSYPVNARRDLGPDPDPLPSFPTVARIFNLASSARPIQQFLTVLKFKILSGTHRLVRTLTFQIRARQNIIQISSFAHPEEELNLRIRPTRCAEIKERAS
jgi:hypothetical protein